MKFSWAMVRDTVKEFWNKLSRPQRIITIAAPLLVLALLTTLIFWANTPQYVPLFTKLSDTEAGSITAKLSELGITYQLGDGGSTILVKQQEAASARLTLANNGLPAESKFSFDYLNQMRLGETDSDRKIRYVLALQNELESTLKTLNGVQDARVHIVQPEQSLFSEQSRPATTTATLKIAQGTVFEEEAIQGIANLLAGSVEGLTVENVTILDTSGNILSEVLENKSNPVKLNATQFQQQQMIESALQRSILSMLERVLGADSVVVRVNAALDYDQVKIIEQLYGAGALVSRQQTSETTTSGDLGAAPGGVTNIPGYTSPLAAGTYDHSANSLTENYNNDQTQREQIVNPGAIERLSISVLVDSENSVVRQTTTAQIEAIVARAAGLVQDRGDQIEVAAIPFNKLDQQQIEQAMLEAAARQRLLRYLEIGAVGALCLIALLIFWIRRRRAKRAEEPVLDEEMDPLDINLTQELLNAQAEAEAEAQARMEEKQQKSADEIEKQKIRESVNIYAHNNPDDVANLVKTWLTEDK